MCCTYRRAGMCLTFTFRDADFIMLHAYILPRHPLQELCEDTFVPNDCHLTGASDWETDTGEMASAHEDESRETDQEGSQGTQQSSQRRGVMLLTGPNACGKVRTSTEHLLDLLRLRSECLFKAERSDCSDGSGKLYLLVTFSCLSYLRFQVGCFVPADAAVVGIVDRSESRSSH